MKTGHINVQTENIFPIIKRFLYSDHEIFLRELVSNAVDASQKLKVLSKNGKFTGELGDLKVEVKLDKEAKTITISDMGIGMTADEIDKYINQIAFSGAEEFVQQYKGKEGTENIIGHFGLGFYSAFMVADKVQIRTLSYQDGSQAVQWESGGNPEYTITDIEKENRGTDIILYISDDTLEFLEKHRLEEILNKYCKFLPVPIIFGTRTDYIDSPEGEKNEDGKIKRVSIEVPNQINTTVPAWVKAPSDLKDEDYKEFYRQLYPMTFDDPLFHIHLNVDYPFNLTGILYFPKISEKVGAQQNKINLYSNQVFITDSVEQIVPEFLTLLHGVIDSPDIPLNVSRSYLQGDGNVKKISSHITKKVADKLKEMFKNDREDFEKKWADLKVFTEYGTLTDEKFAERAKEFTLLKSIDTKFYTVDEYLDKVKAIQTDKDNKVVFLYTNSEESQYGYIKAAKDRGYDVLILDGPLAPHWISKFEQDHTDITLTRVDADTIDNLIKKSDEIPLKLSKEEEENVKKIFDGVVDTSKYHVEIKSMQITDAPIVITQPEFIRRMMEQQQLGGGNMMFGAFPETYNVMVNGNHPKIENLIKESDESLKSDKAKQLTDLALLSQGLLKGESLDKFIERSIEMI